MAVDRPVERIELIDVNDSVTSTRTDGAVGSTASAATPPSNHDRRHGAKVVAVVAVLALAVAVAASLGDAAPSRSRQPVTDAPATPAPPRATTPTAPLPAASGRSVEAKPTGPSRFRLVSDPPQGFVVGPTVESEPGSNTDAGSIDGAGVSMLWSDGPEAAPGSRWFLVTVVPGRVFGDAVGDVRLETASGVVLATRTANGYLRFAGPVKGGSAEIVASGVEAGELVHVLDGLSLAAGRLFLDDGSVPAGLALRSSSQGRGPARWSPVVATTATYSSSDGASSGGSRTITVDSGSRPTAFQQVVEWFFLVGSSRIDVDGEIALIGDNPLTGERALTFDRSGVHVVVAAPVDPNDDQRSDVAIVRVAATLHRAGDAEWDARRGLPTSSGGGSGREPDGAVRVHHAPGAAEVYGFDLEPAGDSDVDTGGGGFATPSTGPAIRWASSRAGTAVVATAPPEADGAVLRVSIGDVSDVARLVGADGSAMLVGVVELARPGLFVAEIVAADGTVLARAAPLSQASTVTVTG